MANQRLVNTNFWKDTYVIDLDPVQKLLFLYFLTNPRTSLAGVYELSIRETAFDTGIDKDMVEKILDKFCDDGKMHYEKGWLVLRNFVKHQRVNPSIVRGIQNAVRELPEWLQNVLKSFDSLYDGQGSVVPDSPQSGTRLYPVSPQKKLKEAKRKEEKLKEKKINKSVAQKTNPRDIDAAFAAWERIVGFPIEGNIEKNRRACSKLLKRYEPDKLERLLAGVEISMTDNFAPRISDFQTLEWKLNDLIVWGRKKGISNAIAQF